MIILGIVLVTLWIVFLIIKFTNRIIDKMYDDANPFNRRF